MQLSFAAAANSMVQNYPKEAARIHPEVLHWVLTQRDIGQRPIRIKQLEGEERKRPPLEVAPL